MGHLRDDSSVGHFDSIGCNPPASSCMADCDQSKPVRRPLRDRSNVGDCRFHCIHFKAGAEHSHITSLTLVAACETLYCTNSRAYHKCRYRGRQSFVLYVLFF